MPSEVNFEKRRASPRASCHCLGMGVSRYEQITVKRTAAVDGIDRSRFRSLSWNVCESVKEVVRGPRDGSDVDLLGEFPDSKIRRSSLAITVNHDCLLASGRRVEGN